jgi:hypothetical protein
MARQLAERLRKLEEEQRQLELELEAEEEGAEELKAQLKHREAQRRPRPVTPR